MSVIYFTTINRKLRGICIYTIAMYMYTWGCRKGWEYRCGGYRRRRRDTKVSRGAPVTANDVARTQLPRLLAPRVFFWYIASLATLVRPQPSLMAAILRDATIYPRTFPFTLSLTLLSLAISCYILVYVSLPFLTPTSIPFLARTSAHDRKSR